MGSRTRPGSQELQTLADAALTDLAFVQVAGSSVADHHRISLRDLAPTTVWLLRGVPGRVGHMSTGTFLDLWWDPRSRLARTPLPGYLGQADPVAQDLPDPNLLLRSPRICGSGLRYDIEIISGTLPRHTGACVLFLGSGTPPA